MTEAQTLMLARIRHALTMARLPAAPEIARRRPPATDSRLPAEQFADEWQKLGGIFLAARREKVPELVRRLLQERGAEAILYWQAEHLPVPEVLSYLRREGVKLPGMDVPADEPRRSQQLAALEKISVGVTGADAALAETGTLALFSGPGRSRLASLTVWTHIALFTPNQIYASLADWWMSPKEPTERLMTCSNLTLISGPSRTADIEMTLTTGVHGPGETIAVMVEDGS